MGKIIQGQDALKHGSGYAALAIGIIVSGIVENDREFLRSEWCKELCDWTGLCTNTGKSLDVILSRRTRRARKLIEDWMGDRELMGNRRRGEKAGKSEVH